MLIAGDETGLLKVVKGCDPPIAFGEQDRGQGIRGLCESQLCSESNFATLREDGNIQHWAVSFNQEMGSPTLQLLWAESSGLAAPLTLKPISGLSDALLAVGSDGQVLLHTASGGQRDASFAVPGPVSACAVTTAGAVFGGKENDVQMYDLHTQQLVWKAKNVPNDKLNLRIPVWITAIDSLQGGGDTCLSTPSLSKQFLTGTAYKQVRLYDTQASQRPAQSFDIDTAFALTAIKASADGCMYYVADGGGNLYQYDLRSGRRLHTLKGCMGSLRSLVLTNRGKTLACLGLDRHLRTYSTQSCKLLTKVYLKNRQTTLLALGGSEEGDEAEEEGEGSERDGSGDESDDLASDHLSDFVDSASEEEEEEEVQQKRRRK